MNGLTVDIWLFSFTNAVCKVNHFRPLSVNVNDFILYVNYSTSKFTIFKLKKKKETVCKAKFVNFIETRLRSNRKIHKMLICEIDRAWSMDKYWGQIFDYKYVIQPEILNLYIQCMFDTPAGYLNRFCTHIS